MYLARFEELVIFVLDDCVCILQRSSCFALKQVIRVKKTRGAAAPCTRITWASFLGSEEPSQKLSRSSELQRTNSSGISNRYNINSLLRLRV